MSVAVAADRKGRMRGMRSGIPVPPGGLPVVLAATFVLGATAALAQTPPETCARDTLRLVSPDVGGLEVTLSEEGRFGAILSWQQPDDAVATCAVVTNADSLDYDILIDGAYADDRDRELTFVTDDAGQVGSQVTGRLLFTWSNRYVSRSGRVSGSFNLSNSGGLLQFDAAARTWNRINLGLPNYLAFTNVVALSQSAQDPERFLAGLDASPPGATLGLRPRGLWEKAGEGSPWRRILPDIFSNDRVGEVRAVAYAPDDVGVFAVGSAVNGLYVFRSGGETWQVFARSLDPTYPAPPSSYQVDALRWQDDGRLFVGIRAFGLFVSTDGGNSFQRLPIQVPLDPLDPSSALTYPRLNAIVVDPSVSSGDHLLAALRDFGLYHSTDRGATWQPLYGDLPQNSVGRRPSALRVAVLDAAGQILVLGTEQRGLWRSGDGGQHWQQVSAGLVPDENWSSYPITGLQATAGGPAYAVVNGVGLVVSEDLGLTWQFLDPQPTILTSTAVLADRRRAGDLLLPTAGGGVYTPGQPLPLTRTIEPGNTDEEYRNIDLGISLVFGEGLIDSSDIFTIKAQDFQGYAVWRSTRDDPFDMEMIGLYDKTNPETCIEGYCGDENYNREPICYAEKRAACFDFSGGNRVVFFDDSIFNGFTYFYAVTTFDYGNLAGTAPPAISRDLLFSPRFPSPESLRLDPNIEGDPDTPFTGPGNLIRFRVDLTSENPEDGDEIYVFPNPLRRGAGLPSGEGELVVWTNLPPESKIQVFTVDGDVVADLDPTNQSGANMFWVTRNEDGKLLASGIYIWRVIMPERGDFWGKLVIIR